MLCYGLWEMTLQVNLKYVTFCMNKSKYIIKFWDVQRPTNNNYNLLSVLDFFPESLCYTNSFAITDKFLVWSDMVPLECGCI